MRKIGLFILIFSIIILLAVCVCFGFITQIRQTGFEPAPVLFAVLFLSVASILTGVMMLCGVFDDL